jgi:hypothetical protein
MDVRNRNNQDISPCAGTPRVRGRCLQKKELEDKERKNRKMPTINQKKEIVKMLNINSLKKALFEKALLREKNPAIVEEYKKAIAETTGSIRTTILILNTLGVKYKAAKMKTTDLIGLCQEYGLDPGETTGAVIFDGYELDGLQTLEPADLGMTIGETN